MSRTDPIHNHFNRGPSIISDTVAETREDFKEDLEQHYSHDIPLDAFDKELLASDEPDERYNHVLQGLPSLPRLPKPSTTTRDCIVPWKARTGINTNPGFRNASSSSPCGNVSSPTLVALSQRKDRTRNALSNLPVQEGEYSSSPTRKYDTGLYGSSHTKDPNFASTSKIQLGHAPPIVQGIPLVSVNDLPDRLRALFPFALFNAVQSKCFAAAFKTDDNIVLSAPTGSGKTAVMELAICRLMHSISGKEFKIVYQAPTKALCSERCNDWQAKFGSLDLQCAELTGDTEASQMRNVQAASIIITTPEKWDSITRRWKDHEKLMRLIKLFLIDEVHILKESRGATLEAVVSRMKSTSINVRFVALSATVPNSDDVAVWLGKDSLHADLPAQREVFGEEFRPVKLQKFVLGYNVRANDFVLDRVLESKLPEIIAKHSHRKPIIVFCPFRNSCISTAKSLVQLWTSTMQSSRLWSGPAQTSGILDNQLREFISAGVAFHHAGLDASDRRAVEQAFLSHSISIICCTSTLAVGVNLPCYLVIIKGTAAWTNSGCQEYADLEMMQMLGRAGRPQFEQSACAVIMTREARVEHYNQMVSGKEPLESCLHLNLIEHLNAEIGLGTISNLASAKRWLASTFLFVRLGRNASHYNLKEDVATSNEYELLDQICSKDLALLRDADLINEEYKLSCTEFGDAMAKYYVNFDTMKTMLSLAPKATLSEIISSIVQAAEFRDIRLKQGEKSMYKQINRDVGIKFPIPVDIALPAHKVSLLLQAELGGVDFPVGEQFIKHKSQFQQDKARIFQHLNRLVRCFIDCQLTRGDSVSTRHALQLARSFAARVWDNSPLQLKQLDQIGNVAVRKLASAGINSLESLENTEAHRIETVLGRGPPFGLKLLSKFAQFPKLRVLVKMMGEETKPQRCIKVRVKAEIGFVNEKVPVFFRRKPIYTCFLAETSDGQILDFRRIPASKLQNGHEIHLTAELTKPSQYILCHVMCDEISGTCKSAETRPTIPSSLFPTSIQPNQGRDDETAIHSSRGKQAPELSRKRKQSQDFDQGGLDDDDMLAAEGLEVMDVDDFDQELASVSLRTGRSNYQDTDNSKKQRLNEEGDNESQVQLKNGKWACNHKCKDKTNCKHLCCREGLDKRPKASKKVSSSTHDDHFSIASMLDVVNKSSTEPSTTQVISKSTDRQSGPMKPSINPVVRKESSSRAGKIAKTLKTPRSIMPNMQSASLRSPGSSLHDGISTTKQSSTNDGAVSRTEAVEVSLPDDPFDSDWADAVGPEDLEDLEYSTDLREPHAGSLSVGEVDKRLSLNDAWPDLDNDNFEFDDEDPALLEASMVGMDDSMQLKKDSNHSSDSRYHKSDHKSNLCFSSHTTHESSPSRIARSKDDGYFDRDNGVHDHEREDFEEHHLVQHHLRETDGDEIQPVGNAPVTSSPNKLFFTSPERPRLAPNLTFAGNASPTQKLDHDRFEPIAKVPAGVEKSPSPSKLHFVSEKTKQAHTAESSNDAATAAYDRKKKQDEEALALRKAGIDQSFYDEFKDIVEFI